MLRSKRDNFKNKDFEVEDEIEDEIEYKAQINFDDRSQGNQQSLSFQRQNNLTQQQQFMSSSTFLENKEETFDKKENKKVIKFLDFTTTKTISTFASSSSLCAPSSQQYKSQCSRYNSQIYQRLQKAINANESAAKGTHHKNQNKITNNGYSLTDFLRQPLPSLPSLSLNNSPTMRYRFQVHFYKYTFNFHIIYELWFCNGTQEQQQTFEMIKILRSDKNTLTLGTPSHLIYQVDPLRPMCQDRESLVAHIVHNSWKSEYNMFDVDSEGNSEERNKTKSLKRYLASASFRSSVLGGYRQMDLYIPKSEYQNSFQGNQNGFLKDEQHKNSLAQYLQKGESQYYSKVQKLTTKRIKTEQLRKVREQLNLKKDLGRTMLLCNSNVDKAEVEDKNTNLNKNKNSQSAEMMTQKLFMGKRQQQRYIVLAADGLSPLQIFMAAIVNLDN